MRMLRKHASSSRARSDPICHRCCGGSVLFLGHAIVGDLILLGVGGGVGAVGEEVFLLS